MNFPLSIYRSKCYPFIAWITAVSFFAFQFILRLWLGLNVTQVSQHFNIGAADFGLLAASYYYGYAGFQLPIALAMERWGVRVMVAGSCILASLAFYLFNYTTNFELALLGRFCLGVGSASGFLGVSKVVSDCFSQAAYGRMIGFSFSLGLLGAVYGGRPISLLLEKHFWQDIAGILSVIGIIIGFIAYFLLYGKVQLANLRPFWIENKANTQDIELKKDADIEVKSGKQPAVKASYTAFLRPILRKDIIILALVNLLLVGVLEGFADVWGISFLEKAYNLNKSDAAGVVSLIFFGMLFGGPCLDYLSSKYGNFRVIAGCGCVIIAIFAMLLYPVAYNYNLFWALFFLLGIACCYQVLLLSAGTKRVELHEVAVTVAFLNSANMLGGSFFHTIIGNIMLYAAKMGSFYAEISSEVTPAIKPAELEGSKEIAVVLTSYSLQAYQYALLVIPVAALVGVILILSLKKQS